MLLIGSHQIAEALGVEIRSVQRRTTGMPPVSEGKYKTNRKYHAAGVVGSLCRYERARAPMVLAHGVEDGSLYAGPDSIIAANRFMDWCAKHPETYSRWQAAYACFMRVLIHDPSCGPYAPYAESLARRAMLWGGVAVYIVTGDKSNLPDWTRFAPAFSLVNAGGLDAVTLAAVEEESWM